MGITRDAAEGFIQKVQKMQQISMWRRWWHGRDRGLRDGCHLEGNDDKKDHPLIFAEGVFDETEASSDK